MISLRGMLRVIRFDTLRRVNNVGFLVELLNYMNDAPERKKNICVSVDKELGVCAITLTDIDDGMTLCQCVLVL